MSTPSATATITAPQPVTAVGAERHPAVEPLGPDSLTWKYFGDIRTGMMGMWIGAIENMYPGLGAGVEDHSSLWREPLQRVFRSVYPIMGVVYDGDRAGRTGTMIRDWHRDIKGVDSAGRRYHALDPATFYWAHATFFMMVIKLADYFGGGLTEAQKHQLFDEHVQWYAQYGMSMRPVPDSWEDFCAYWDRVCADELEYTKAADGILNMRIPKPWFVLMPDAVWGQLFKPMLSAQRWIATGLFEPVVREKAGLQWNDGDEILFRLFGKAVQIMFAFVPDEVRLHPRALAGYRREHGREQGKPVDEDAPLVEAPWFMGPPKDRRDNGMHYVPPGASPARALLERAGSLVHGTFSLAGGLAGGLGRARVA